MRENKRTMVGQVVTNKMDKTVVVEIKSRQRHPLYRRIINRTTRFKAHDAENKCSLGDQVRIMESRPLSKEKHWQVIEVLTKGHVADVKPVELDRPVLEELQPARTAAAPATEAEEEA
jgi:small subunit ribosomal protein S17